MAIAQTLCSSFKQQLFLAQHDLSTDEIKIALYTSAASIGPDTTVYSVSDEVVGTGYTAGGDSPYWRYRVAIRHNGLRRL